MIFTHQRSWAEVVIELLCLSYFVNKFNRLFKDGRSGYGINRFIMGLKRKIGPRTKCSEFRTFGQDANPSIELFQKLKMSLTCFQTNITI